MGYDEINLNCGCPAGSRGEAQEHYGARLMAESSELMSAAARCIMP